MRVRVARTRDWALEHPVLFVLVVAFAVRVVAAIAVTATIGMEDQFSDTLRYDRFASDLASGRDSSWSIEFEAYYDRFSGYVLPLSVLYRLFGDYLFLGQLLAAAFGAVTAAVVCRLILELKPQRWALFGGLIVALFPSQVLWSSVGLRDSAVWAVTASMALLFVWAGRASGWPLASYGLAITALLFWLAHLRIPTFIVVAWVLAAAALFTAPAGRLVRVSGAVTLLLLMPWYVGIGVAGVSYGSAYEASDIRVGGAEEAHTAIDDTAGADQSNLEHLPRGLTVLLLEPYPWKSVDGVEVRLAQVELLLWYPLLIVAAAGILAMISRRRELAFPVLTAGGMLVVYALYEGNFGTAFRHRAELIPALAMVAVLGVPALLGWWQRRAISQPDRAGSAPSA